MKQQLRSLFSLFFLFTLITGVVYPLVVTGIAQAVFNKKANGSLVVHENQIIGSELIGQNFVDDKYFWGRPSATGNHPYNAFDQDSLTGSSGSNFGPLSLKLYESVEKNVLYLQQKNPDSQVRIPVDLVTSSASGLDPHISVQAAYFQAPRIAIARGLELYEVNRIIDEVTETRQFGILGEPRVNVLSLNLKLDGIQ